MKDLYRNQNNGSLNQGQNAHLHNSNQEKLLMNNNINSYREVLSEVRSPHPPQLPSNEFGIPNIGAFPQSVTNA